jgi:hypothetical protein
MTTQQALLKINSDFTIDASEVNIEALGGLKVITDVYGATKILKIDKGLGLSFKVEIGSDNDINHIAIKYNDDESFQLEFNKIGPLTGGGSIHLQGIESVSKYRCVSFFSVRSIVNKELGLINEAIN